jgi:hypothetical protein
VDDDRPPWDPETADSLLGKHVLVGLTRCSEDGEVLEQTQFHGEIVVVDERDGVAIERAGSDELFWLPPDLRAYHDAPPGEYRLRSTGEVVVDPDVTTSWTITAPPEEEPEAEDAPPWRQLDD